LNTTHYAAFLRGINVGGNKKVPMEDLKKVFALLGYKNIRTLLNSGNVIFEAEEKDADELRRVIEIKLEKKFGFPIPILIRTIAELQALAKADPFKGIDVILETRLYVSFLSEKPLGKLKIPYQSSEKNYKILFASKNEVCSVLTLSPNTQSTDLMSVLEKEYGKKITTRNWNTIEKILAL
jgi:uncharacterized protein (DUF1697 family)